MGVDVGYSTLEENCDNANVCLDYIDQQLGSTSDQTISIAEKLIENIGDLNEQFRKAVSADEKVEKAKDIIAFQDGLIGHLHEIILEQSTRDLNGQVIIRLKNFMKDLKDGNATSLKIPSHVLVAKDIDTEDVVGQEDIDKMFD